MDFFLQEVDIKMLDGIDEYIKKIGKGSIFLIKKPRANSANDNTYLISFGTVSDEKMCENMSLGQLYFAQSAVLQTSCILRCDHCDTKMLTEDTVHIVYESIDSSVYYCEQCFEKTHIILPDNVDIIG